MIIAKISNCFIKSNFKLSWRDVLWGLNNGFLSYSYPIELASNKVDEDPNQLLIDLLFMPADSHPNDIKDLVERLAAEEIETAQVTADKWRYLLLLWIYENRCRFESPLNIIEMIYSDFGYPDDMRPFIYYLPSEDGYNPSLHSEAENHERMLNNLKEFLDDRASLYKKNS